EGDTEGFVNVPLDIADVRLSILIKEDNGRARVSLRSKRGTSANRCAIRYFHGGGHELAAGGKLFFPEDIPAAGDAQAYILNNSSKFFSR
ncbi:MAG: bifunctional oligoribonuclease/PAP phosphatase NrnA, partial [Candidatus Cryptobacteroides sp.]